jgi:hypothetical protein
MAILGLPDELVYAAAAIIALAIVLKLLGKPGRRARVAPGIPAKGSPLESLMEEPGVTAPSEELAEVKELETGEHPASSLEKLLAGKPEEVPSIGPEEMTDVEKMLAGVKFEEKPKVRKGAKPAEEEKPKKKPKEEKPGKKKKGLEAVEGEGEAPELEEFAEELEEPEPRPRYRPPPEEAEEKPAPPAPPEGPKKYEKKGIFAALFGGKPEEKPEKEPDAALCMHAFDAGKTPMAATKLLQHRGLTREKAKEKAFKLYKLWIDKREPILRDIKETKEMLKRIEYKFLKRQIDNATRDSMMNDANKKLIELEARLASSEDYFTE